MGVMGVLVPTVRVGTHCFATLLRRGRDASAVPKRRLTPIAPRSGNCACARGDVVSRGYSVRDAGASRSSAFATRSGGTRRGNGGCRVLGAVAAHDPARTFQGLQHRADRLDRADFACGGHLRSDEKWFGPVADSGDHSASDAEHAAIHRARDDAFRYLHRVWPAIRRQRSPRPQGCRRAHFSRHGSGNIPGSLRQCRHAATISGHHPVHALSLEMRGRGGCRGIALHHAEK